MCTQQCICTFRVHAPRARSDGSSNLVQRAGRRPDRPASAGAAKTCDTRCVQCRRGRSLPRPGSTIEKAIFNRRASQHAGRRFWSTLVAARGGHRRGHGAYLATPGRRESAIHDCQKSNDARTRRPARPPPPHINRIVVGVVARGTNISRMSSLHERLIAGSRRRGFAVCSIVRIVDSYSKNAPRPPLG